MTEQQRMALQQYQALLDDFISGRIPPAQFESEYLKKFKSETVIFPDPVFSVLDRLFADVDAYCADSSIRDPDDLGDTELITSAKQALAELAQLGVANVVLLVRR